MRPANNPGNNARADGRVPGRLAPNRFHEAAWIVGPAENLHIADDVWIGAFCVIDAARDHIAIGEGSVIASGAHVYTHSSVRRTLGVRKECEHAQVRIGSRTSICANATVLMGCDIGNNCVVGAGAVLTEGSVVPSECVVVGNPARIVRRLLPSALARGQEIECRCAWSRRKIAFSLPASLQGGADSIKRRESVLTTICEEHSR